MFPSFSAETHWQGSTRRFALEVRDGTLEFWDVEREHPGEWRFAVWYPIHQRDAAYWTQDTLENLWRVSLERQNIGRRVDLSDELTFFLRQNSPKKGKYRPDFFRFRGRQGEIRSEAYHYKYQNLFEYPLAHWFQNLERSCSKNYEGQLGERLYELGIEFAFNPEGLYSSKRGQFDRCLTRGTQEDLIHVNDLIWKLDPGWIDAACVSKIEWAGLQVLARPDRPARAIPGGFDKNWGWQPTDHPRQELWDEMLRYFEPYPNPVAHALDIERGARLFLEFWGPSSKWGYNEHTGEIIEPTQHERLELHLELRDWLRDRAGLADERIAHLLN